MTGGLNNGSYAKCIDNHFDSCYPVYSNLLDAIAEHFWTIFGYGWAVEPPAATLIPTKNNVSNMK